MRPAARAAALLALNVTALALPARACTLDDVDAALSRDTLNHYYPGALDVLTRVVDARRMSGLPPSPGLTPTPLHVQRLMALASQLDRQMRATAGSQQTEPIALLLIESMLWARIPPLPSNARAQLHAAGPEPSDLVLVTSEDTVRQIVSGQTTLDQAKTDGFVRIYGPETAVSDLASRLGPTGRNPASAVSRSADKP